MTPEHNKLNFNQIVPFSPRVRNWAFGGIGLGLILIIVSAFMYSDAPARIWANFLLSNFFFMAISVTALAFMGINYIANAGWFTNLKRIAEAMGAYIPVAFFSVLVLIIAHYVGWGSIKSLFLWTHPEDVASEHARHVIEGKHGYLNMSFWMIRLAIYFGIWWVFYYTYRKWSFKEDAEGRPTIEWFNKSTRLSAGWVPAYALTFAFCSYDLLMSIMPLWYSTMFAVNVFAAALVGAISVIMIIAAQLKKNGYLEYVNDNHFHDLGKFMFGFSIFWTYTWLSQYLLIWYANLPEETPFYFDRQQGGWWYLFFLNFGLNFIFPFLFLMMRESKRRMSYLTAVGIVLLIGKYTDWYLIIMPNTAGQDSGFGFPEIGFMLFYGGLFTLAVGNALSKISLYPKNHPYVMESVQHEI